MRGETMKTLILTVTAVVLWTLYPLSSECGRTRRAGGPAIREIRVVGTAHYSQKKIKSLMRTKESKFLRTRRLRESTLEADLVSIVAFYRRNGFLNATASIDELRHDEERGNVWIRIKVHEGQQTTVADVILEGNNYVASETLSRMLSIKVGEPLNEALIGQDKYNIYSYYADMGFVFASVSHQTEGEDGIAMVRYRITEGAPAGIRAIGIRGNNRINEGIIRREVTLKPGDTFSRKKVLDSQQKLYDTGLFKDVEIEPSAAETDSGLVNLLVKVKERKMREASLGLGYGTRDETRLILGWLHRNLWNSGRQFEIRTILATKDFEKGLTRTRGDVSLTDRWLFGMRLVGGVAVFAQESLEEYKEVDQGEYTLDRLGADLSIKKDLSRSTDLTLSYTHEYVDVREPSWRVEDPQELRLQIGQEINRSALVVLDRDTRVPFFDPRRGSLTRVIARTSGGVFGGDNSYSKITWSWARYLASYGRSVAAVGVRIGWSEAFGESKGKGVPEYERFYVGGSSTIRGYDEREFGPGDFLLVANVEIRYPLVWKLVGVVFLDLGNAWGSIRDIERSDFDLRVPADEYTPRRASDCKYSVGIGLGVQTPVGPARVDYGMRLKRGLVDSGRKESRGMIHITVGHAF
jgi:outer membrane protein insertion porin family